MRTLVLVAVMMVLVATPLFAQEVIERDYGAAARAQQFQEQVEQFELMGMDHAKATFMAMILSGQMDPQQALLMMMMMDQGGGDGDAFGMLLLMSAMRPNTTPPQPVVIDRENHLWALIADKGVLYKINLDTMEPAGAVPYAQGATPNGNTMDVMMPMLQQEREEARQAACLSNLKQIGLAALMFAQDHNQKLPPAGWPDEVQPYIKNTAIYVCPSRPDVPVAYAMNVKVVGAALKDIARPSETIIFFETNMAAAAPVGGPELVPEGGIHNGGVNVCYVDGHCKWISVDEAKEELAQPVN